MKTTSIKTKKTNLINLTRIKGNFQMKQICSFFDWTDQQYCDHQYQQYEEFLAFRMRHYDHSTFNKVRYSPLMRGFWNNEWIRRNEDIFIPTANFHLFSGCQEMEDGEIILVLPQDGVDSMVYDDYMAIHNGKLLATDREMQPKIDHMLTLIYRSK
jgi:hypothetical protein